MDDCKVYLINDRLKGPAPELCYELAVSPGAIHVGDEVLAIVYPAEGDEDAVWRYFTITKRWFDFDSKALLLQTDQTFAGEDIAKLIECGWRHSSEVLK